MQLLDPNIGIDFGARGNLREFSPTGFSPVPEETSTWTEHTTAELMFRVPPLRADLRITVEASPFIAAQAGVTLQECWVYLNGLFLLFRKLHAAAELAFTVPRDQLVMRGNRLSFVMPLAASPSELGIGDDVRRLGLAFIRLTARA